MNDGLSTTCQTWTMLTTMWLKIDTDAIKNYHKTTFGPYYSRSNTPIGEQIKKIQNRQLNSWNKQQSLEVNFMGFFF